MGLLHGGRWISGAVRGERVRSAASVSRVLIAPLVAVALGYLLRNRLVGVLTTTTGTWVGSPASPQRVSRTS